MISIVIPVLNEASIIKSHLIHISESLSSENRVEVLIVDGGSNDGTQTLVSNFSETSDLKIKLLSSERGRAKQMNKGAKHAQGEVLYFLHADSFPPKNFDQKIINEISNGNLCGCFRMKFDKPHLILKISQWFTRFNHKVCRGGDQSLFVTRNIFTELNGFNEDYEIYEDCEFINRLYATQHFTVIKDYVTTSSRRYDSNGTWKLQYHFTIIHLKKWIGASPKSLYNYYKRHIVS